MKRINAQAALCLLTLLIAVTTGCVMGQNSTGHKPLLTGFSDVPSAKPLAIGDQLPLIKVNNVYKYTSQNFQLPLTDDKVTVLHFFATWCSPCIAELPYLDSLQKEFNSKLQIFLVSYENSEKVQSFFKSNRVAGAINLPIISDDSLLNKFFPHTSVPHNVWLTSRNRVAAITSSSHLTRSNIQSFIDEKKMNLPVKREVMDFDSKKPFFINGNGGNGENIQTRSLITGYVDGLVSTWGLGYGKDNQLTRIYAVNSPILDLYKHALNKSNVYYPANRLILQVKEKSKFNIGEDWESWREQNTYCYELIVRPTNSEKIHQYMMEDLERYFGISMSLVKRKVKCMVLKVNSGDKIKLAYTKGGNPDYNLYEKNNVAKFITNMPIQSLTARLDDISPYPVLDETNLTENVDLVLPIDLRNFDSVKVSLNRYGLTLVENEREVEMVLFTE